MNVYANAKDNAATQKLGMKYYLLGHLSAGGYEMIGYSDTEFLFQTVKRKIILTMMIPSNYSIEAYDNLAVVITVSSTGGDAKGMIYFQSLVSYTHVHTTLL